MTDFSSASAFLTPGQVADHVQVSTKTVMRAIARRDLRAVRIGLRGAWRIRPDDVEAWLETRANRPRHEPPRSKPNVNVRDHLAGASPMRQRARTGRVELADL